MGSMGKALVKGIAVDDLIRLLDSLYALEMLATHYSLAVLYRLEGQAHVLLEEVYDEKAKENFEHARKIAERLSQLGGTVTGDPTRFVAVSPFKQFTLPGSNGDVQTILKHTLEQVRVAIRAYGDALEQVRDKDDITLHELVEILEDHVATEDEIEVALVN